MSPEHPRTVTRQLSSRFPSDLNFETVVEEKGSFACPTSPLKSFDPTRLWIASGLRSVRGTEEFTDCAEHLEAVRLRLFRIQKRIKQLHLEGLSAPYVGELQRPQHARAVPARHLQKGIRQPVAVAAIPPPDMQFV